MEIAAGGECFSVGLECVFLVLEQGEEVAYVLEDIIFFWLCFLRVAVTLHNDQILIIR